MEQSTNMGFHAENFVLRGNYALEDRNFQKAEQFFEQALNLDAKCAEAYLGSFLVQVQCSSLEEYIHFRLQETAPAVAAPQPMQKNMSHIEKMVEQYAVEPHFTADAIRTIYRQDFYYDSCVPQRRAQRKQEEELWDEQPLLSRTERLATGAFAQKLTQAKLDFFATLDQRIADAETDDIAAQQAQLLAYEEFLYATDRQVIQSHEAVLNQLEVLYLQYSNAMEETRISKLKEAQNELLQLGDYKDSLTLAQQYQQRITELAEKMPEAKKPEKKKTQEKKPKKENPAKQTAPGSKKPFVIGAAVLAIVALVICLAVFLPKNKDNSAPSAETVKELTPEEKYAQAEQLLRAEDLQGAISLFRELGDYKDSAARAAECEALQALNDRYAEAEELLAVGDKRGSLMIFRELGDHKDAAARAEEVRLSMMAKTSLCYGGYLFGVKTDGTVVVADNDYMGPCDVSSWTDIVAVDSAYSWYTGTHAIGLKKDGTVVTAGSNKYGQCNTADWTDIIAVDTNFLFTVGLRADGTVVATGDNTYGQCDVSGWADIVAIDTCSSQSNETKIGYTLGLKSDGTVVAAGWNKYGQCDVSGWTDIVAIDTYTSYIAGRSSRYSYTVGLKSDGTVVACGKENLGVLRCVSEWTDIVDIVACYNGLCAIKSDGTVVAWGAYSSNISKWTDIVSIVSCGDETCGLKKDGTVVVAGKNANEYGVSAWTDIVAIKSCSNGVAGLKSDGTVVIASMNDRDSKALQWTDIRLPDEE